MNIRTFNSNDYPSFVDIHFSLDISWPERPRDPQAWADADKNRNPKCKYQRWIASVDDRAVGFGTYGQGMDDYHPQRFYVNVEVRPEYQRQGIGAALYEHVMDGLQPFDPRVLRADSFTNLPQGYRFLQQRGFKEVFRETPVWLDIANFDPSPYADLEPALRQQGIVIKTLRELESDPDRDRKLYELYWDAVDDVPQEDTKLVRPEFEEWIKWGVNDPSILHDAYFVAVRGDEYLGLRELGKYPGSDTLVGGLLGVRREWRQRGIGLAMQLRGIAYAKEFGCPVLKTCTAVQNAPMQALFNKLGYQRGPEWQQCQKDIQP